MVAITFLGQYNVPEASKDTFKLVRVRVMHGKREKL